MVNMKDAHGWTRNEAGEVVLPESMFRPAVGSISRPDTTPDGTAYASRADMHRDMANLRPAYR